MRLYLILFVALTVLVVALPSEAKILNRDAGPGAVWVETKGEAPIEGDEDAYKKEALDRAKRAALEEGGRTFIESQTKVENFQTIKDQIFTYTEGIVTDTTILKKGERYDRYYVKIRCKVHTQGLANKWQALRALIEKRGKPRIMVVIAETNNGVYSRSGSAQTLLQDELLKRRMPLVDESQMKAISEKQLKAAQLDQDLATIAAIGRKFNAEIVIAGVCEGRYAGIQNAYGVNLHRSNAELTLKAVKTSNGDLLVSKRVSINASARERQKAEKDAMAKAGQAIALPVINDLVRQWFFEEDRGMNITVKITKIGYREMRKMQKALKKNKKIKSVNRRNYSNKIVEFEVQTMYNSTELLDVIMDLEIAELDVKVQQPNILELVVIEEDE